MPDAALRTQARSQRVYANEKVRLAKKDYEENSHFNRSSCVITFDYTQNLQFPHFGEEKPGNTYYFSPLNLLMFGIVNHSPENDQMYRCLHHEGKKGSNNAGSLIKLFLLKHIK